MLLGQVLDELVVHLGEDGIEVGAEPQRDTQHSRHLRGAQRGTDAMPGSVAQQHEQPVLVERHQIEGVATRLIGRAELPRHVVPGDPRHFRWQRAHLDFTRQLDLAIELLGLLQRPRHPLALDEHDALHRQRLGDALVLGRKRRVALAINDLQHADEGRVLDQRHGEHATDVVVEVQVHGGIEDRVAADVGNVDDLA